MTHKVEDGVTECGTSASRKLSRTFGQCRLCPDWREPQPLINGLCFEHRIWGPPQGRAGRKKQTKN
jgi:hypothetical protein